MNLLKRPAILSFVVLLHWLAISPGHAQTRQIATPYATLTVDKEGLITIKSNKNAEITARTSTKTLWNLVLKNEKTSNSYESFNTALSNLEQEEAARVSQQGEEIILDYNNLKIQGAGTPLSVQCRISVKNQAFNFSATLNNSSNDWLIREFTYPVFTSVKVKDNQATVYWPSGLGQRFDNPAAFGKRSFDYPSGRGTMQWFSINTENEGLYVSSTDETRSKKSFETAYSKENKAFSTAITFPVFQNTFKSPDVLITPYAGKWFEAAKRYRNWFDSKFKMPEIPEWVKMESGWMLAILKQQNGYVMWKYHELDQLCDIAEKRGFKTIGLFGWANGGHDYLYPNYIPDDLMGGWGALKAAIERAHKRGFKIVVYANGTLIDAGTEYYRYEGNNAIAIKEDKSAYTSSIRKYNSSTPVVFAEASFSSRVWRKTMLDLALQAHELGADGILYDQVGVKGAMLNFSKIQDHTLPQEPGSKYRIQMMHEIRTTLKKLNPDFVVMTEGVNDAVLTDTDYFHGWGDGTYPDANVFPGLFKYTFPELVKTQRHSSPMLPRYHANFGLVTGQRHEIETRWEADVDYLKHGKMPTENSYQDEAYFAPNYKQINEVSAEEATKYLSDLILFENRNAGFFRYGKFVDEDGFTVKGADILAKGFQNGNRLGIIVWNQHKTQSNAYEIEVPGYQFAKAEAPEPDNKTGALKANSVRLLIYEKK